MYDLEVNNDLFYFVDRSIMETIFLRDTAKDIWDAMRHKLHGSSKVKLTHLQALCSEFVILAIGENETIDEHFARTLGIANCITIHGERIKQVLDVEKILRSMKAKFYVVRLVEESNDMTSLSIDKLQSSLMKNKL